MCPQGQCPPERVEHIPGKMSILIFNMKSYSEIYDGDDNVDENHDDINSDDDAADDADDADYDDDDDAVDADDDDDDEAKSTDIPERVRPCC